MNALRGPTVAISIALLALTGCGPGNSTTGDSGADANGADTAAIDAQPIDATSGDATVSDTRTADSPMFDDATDTPVPLTDGGDASCVSDKLVPLCGGAWWGMSEAPMTGETPASAFARIETAVGRHFDIAHFYHTDSQAFPTPTEQALSDSGHFLLLNWKPQTGANGWRIAASGSIDASVIGPAADRLSAFGRPVFLALYHEPENDIPTAGTPAEYVSMWQHVRSVFDAHHVTNVIWVWDMMGFSGHAAHYLSGDLYPGDSYVDWIAYDPYNQGSGGSSWSTFETITEQATAGWSGFYTWATTTHPSKPLMIAEYGTPEDPTNPARKGQWFGAELTTLMSTRSAIRAAVYWDGVDLPLLVTTSAMSLAGYTAAGHSPFLNRPHH